MVCIVLKIVTWAVEQNNIQTLIAFREMCAKDKCMDICRYLKQLHNSPICKIPKNNNFLLPVDYYIRYDFQVGKLRPMF